jgi:hypothetical protein
VQPVCAVHVAWLKSLLHAIGVPVQTGPHLHPITPGQAAWSFLAQSVGVPVQALTPS